MPTVNSLGLERSVYKGPKSTLCSGCGHDSITNNLVSALYQSGVDPYQLAKISGIGCSSKTPTYFSERSAGFNSLHGRMAPLATGAHMANRSLKILGISGDGDSASIGLGGFCHALRRNLDMIYVVENNGVYGLTKGQFSATSEKGALRKSGELNQFASIDLCSLAIEMGCGFVARSFSGDAKQLVPLLRAAMEYRGTAFIDIISPCVTFAKHSGATVSYDSVKQRKVQLQELGFIAAEEEIQGEYGEGQVHQITLHDGSFLSLKKIGADDHDVTSEESARQILYETRKKQQFATGLFYYSEDSSMSLVEKEELCEKPLVDFTLEQFQLSQEQINRVFP